MSVEDDFEKDILNKSELKKVQDIVNQYNFHDAIKAIFCINAYIGSRSHLTLLYRLNATLVNYKQSKNKSINSYFDFLTFFKLLTENYDSSFDDPISLDNGEILFNYNGVYRKCILGNGYNRSYGLYNSLYTFAEKLDVLDEMEIILENNDNLIEFVSNNNSKPKDYNHHKIYAPSEEFYEFVFSNFDTYSENYKESNYDCSFHRIIDTFSFTYKNKRYPLYNVCSPISFISSKLRELNISSLLKLSKRNLLNTVFSQYDAEINHFICGGFFVKDLQKKEILCNQMFDLIICSDDKILIFKDSYDWTEKEEKDFVREINNLLSTGVIKVFENIGEQNKLIEIKGTKKIEIFNFFSGLHYETGNELIRNDHHLIHYYDLIQILLFSNSISDICDFFFNLSSISPRTLGFTFITDLYILFKNQGNNIESGAINFGSIIFDTYNTENHILDLFNNFHKWFSFNYNPILKTPFIWVPMSEGDEVFEFSNKVYNNSLISLIKKANNKNFVFNFNPLIGGKYSMEVMTNIGMLRDLIMNYLPKFDESFYGLFSNEISFLFMSMEFAMQDSIKFSFKRNHKFVFSDCIKKNGHILVRYCVDFESFKNSQMSAKDNSIEIAFWIELFECIGDSNFCSKELLEEYFKKFLGLKKELILFNFAPKHFYSDKPMSFYISPDLQAKIDKKMSFFAKQAEFEEGEYTKKDFRNKVRRFQKDSIKQFENEISKFDKEKLHILLLSILSTIYFERNMVSTKTEMLEKDEFSERCIWQAKRNIINEENKNKFALRSILYLIDTNLAITHKGVEIPLREDVNYLICLSNFLVDLQDNSDIANYDIAPVKLKVEYDYRIYPIYDNKTSEKIKIKNDRIAKCRAYIPSLKTKYQNHITKAMEAFFLDTNINFIDMKNILTFLSDSIGYEKYSKKPNVIKIKKEELLTDIEKYYKEQNIKPNDLENVLNFLVIDTNQIKQQNGKTEEFVPLWNREGRNNRFEIRPLYFENDYFIYSPIQCFVLDKMWSDSFFQFFLPYDYKLENFRKYIIEIWKPECEKLMENDVKNLFIVNGIKAEKSIYLHSRFPNSNYPNDLGDYDVLAVDEVNKVIYNIESKYLIFQGSIREYYNFQDWFFVGSKRKDKNFKKRIDYLKHHTSAIMLDVFNIADISGYTIKNFMVTNKILTCDIKKIDFDIISYSELEDLLLK
ncbi:MAG: hypothetical protein MJ222_02855 [Bacilli bacterium]|nr:hypothetical protein [Bacilli bacterium]